MAAINNIPVPPAIVATAASTSASSTSAEGDGNFASTLAAVQNTQDQNRQDKSKQDKSTQNTAVSSNDSAPVAQDTTAQNAGPEIKESADDNGWQVVPSITPATPDISAAPAIPVTTQAQAAADDVPQPDDLPVAQAPVETSQIALPATPKEADGDAKDEDVTVTKPQDRKAETTDPNTLAALPVPAPVTDVVPAMLPVPVAQFGEASKAKSEDMSKTDETGPELRASIAENGGAASVKPGNSETPASSKADGDQAANAAATEADKVQGKAEQQQQKRDGDSQDQRQDTLKTDAQKSDTQKTDTQKTEATLADTRAAAAAEAFKPATSQAQAQNNNQASSTAAQSVGSMASAQAGPGQSATQATGATAVAFHQAHETQARPDQLAFAISTQSKDGARNFEIRLDPPELGRVEVKLSTDDTGKTQATVLVERPHALELLQRDARTLEQALRDSGLDLTQNGLSFSLKGEDRQAQQEQNAPFVRAKILNMELTAAETAQAHINSILPSGSARLDIRV